MQPSAINIADARARLDTADHQTIWPAPDMSILSAGRRSAPVMPRDMFGAIWPLLEDLAEGAGAPVDYVAVSFLAVAASLIGGKRWVTAFSSADWSEPCILWTALVGDPSSAKSPAISAVTDHLRVMERDHKEAHDDALADWEAKAERATAERAAWKKNVEAATKDGLATPSLPDNARMPDQPERRRLLVQDATPEAIAAILSGNPSGTLALRDELAGWLMSFDRYSNGGGREFWLEAYGGRPHVVDRKGTKGAISIKFNGVSVLGGVQPEKLAACLLDSVDDGLVARFLWAWPDGIMYRRPRRRPNITELDRLYRRLDGLRWGTDDEGRDARIMLQLDDAAADIFEAWIKESQFAEVDAGSLFKGFCGKLRGTVLRLALIAELIAWAASDDMPEPRTVSAQSIAAAIEFAEEYAKPSALRVFGDAARSPADRDAAIIARWIKRHRLPGVNSRELTRSPQYSGPKKRQPLDDALAVLVEADWLRSAPSRAGDNAGRPRKDFLVNPAVHVAV